MILTLVITACLLVPLIALLRRQVRRLRGSRIPAQWIWVCIAAMVAGVCGVAANWVEFPVSSQMRIIGVPTPMVFFHWEGGQWVDFPVPWWWMNLTANIIVFALAGVVAVLSLLGRRGRTQRTESDSTSQAGQE